MKHRQQSIHVTRRHSKGDILPIFQKPYTREDFEGTARLERFMNNNVGGKPATFEEATYERIIQP